MGEMREAREWGLPPARIPAVAQRGPAADALGDRLLQGRYGG